MDLEGEISWVTNFTLGATTQATLVYITFETFIMVPVSIPIIDAHIEWIDGQFNFTQD